VVIDVVMSDRDWQLPWSPIGAPSTTEVVVGDSWRMHFANSVTIRQPPSEVFAFLINPANIPKWNYAIDSAARSAQVRSALGHGSNRRGQFRGRPPRSS
jgi:hypothetical protein